VHMRRVTVSRMHKRYVQTVLTFQITYVYPYYHHVFGVIEKMNPCWVDGVYYVSSVGIHTLLNPYGTYVLVFSVSVYCHGALACFFLTVIL